MKPHPKKFVFSEDIIIISLQSENKLLRQKNKQLEQKNEQLEQENQEYNKFVKALISTLRKAQESFDKGVFKRSDLES